MPLLVSIPALPLIQRLQHKQKHQVTLMGALHTIIRFKELTGSRIEVLQFKIIWSFQGHAKSFCMPLPPPQDIFREASGTSTHISKVEQLCIILLYQRHLQKETEEILLTHNSSRQSNHVHHKLHCSEESFKYLFSQLAS